MALRTMTYKNLSFQRSQLLSQPPTQIMTGTFQVGTNSYDAPPSFPRFRRPRSWPDTPKRELLIGRMQPELRCVTLEKKPF
jgi:hypothetical protein